MPRYHLCIEYDGTGFCGWQRQANGPSVQQTLEVAFAALNEPGVEVHGAGRTDAGVHALAQSAHADCAKPWQPFRLQAGLNAHLRPHAVAVTSVREVSSEFHARFSAVERHYLYRIINRRAPLALEARRAWLVMRRLDARAMHEAAQILVGDHDFSTFRDSECQANSPQRHLNAFSVRQSGDVIEMRVSARSFLHRQVRSMVGSLEHVGSGKWQAQDLADALEARDRARCGEVAPACGLFLAQVDY
ncbi:MAG: tRNA pseudouridine(38-40) synthase TruA [Hyphomicrobiales bacterium]|nr:tRNA pseudouridine(38-40) synthase TruA [Hyphomicrobiales bacterium]